MNNDLTDLARDLLARDTESDDHTTDDVIDLGRALAFAVLNDAEATRYVHVVRLPSDDYSECYVYSDWDTASILKDAIDGAQVTEEPVLDADHARTLVEQEIDA